MHLIIGWCCACQEYLNSLSGKESSVQPCFGNRGMDVLPLQVVLTGQLSRKCPKMDRLAVRRKEYLLITGSLSQ